MRGREGGRAHVDFPSDDEASLQQRDVLLRERGGINGLQAGDDIDPEVSSSLAQVALVVANQLRTKLDLDHTRQVITVSRGLRRLGRLVVDRVFLSIRT